ncbi:hypothetical protein GY45DRAFT_1376434 [Cubamyces sp. BRFM 1775]|nr:hypothetical protein GY45DRAFT_1376434 [Cubamyces sp. BRFM 1775]
MALARASSPRSTSLVFSAAVASSRRRAGRLHLAVAASTSTLARTTIRSFDIVSVKKKSHLGLDGMMRGTLGERTNVPAAPKDTKQALVDNNRVKPEKQGTVSSVKTLLDIPVVDNAPTDPKGGENAPVNGLLSSDAPPVGSIALEDGSRTLSGKKQSVLGLGLPSTLRLGTVRDVSGSATGSGSGVAQAPLRLSVNSADLILNAQGRPSSILSSGSCLRPPWTASGISTFSGRSPRSSSSSVASVRWDETNLHTAKEIQWKGRRTQPEKDKEAGKTTRESRRSSDPRRRTPISEIFPDAQMQAQAFQQPKEPAVMQAMLEHSQKNYGPLASELRPHHVRSRTSSRASPYPLRNQRSAFSPEKPRALPVQVFTDGPNKPFAAPAPELPVLCQVQCDMNVYQSSPAPALYEIKPFSPIHIKLNSPKQVKSVFGLQSRPRIM